MKFKYLLLLGLLLAGSTECFAQKKVAIWKPFDNEGVLNDGIKHLMADRAAQAISETMYGYEAFVREEGDRGDHEVAYTQQGNTKTELRSGMEEASDYYLNAHIYKIEDGVVSIKMQLIASENKKVLVTAIRDYVEVSPARVLLEEFKDASLDVVNRLIAIEGRESVVKNYWEIPDLRLQVQTVDAGTANTIADAEKLCDEIAVSRGENKWRLPTENEMMRIFRDPEAPIKLHIEAGESYMTSTRSGAYIQIVTAKVLDKKGSFLDTESKDTRVNIKQFSPSSEPRYEGRPYKVRAVRNY